MACHKENRKINNVQKEKKRRSYHIVMLYLNGLTHSGRELPEGINYQCSAYVVINAEFLYFKKFRCIHIHCSKGL